MLPLSEILTSYDIDGVVIENEAANMALEAPLYNDVWGEGSTPRPFFA